MIRILQPRNAAFISTFTPRECGIATFTADLIRNITAAGQIEFRPSVVAVDTEPARKYSEPVKHVIRRNTAADYIEAADYINSRGFDAVSLQHEFGLFGGEGGSHISFLLKRLKVPVITTLHTVLQEPSGAYAESLVEVCRRSDAIVVMNERGVEMLTDVYNVPRTKIRLIPHGVPDVPFVQKTGSRKKIIFTFGLLSRNKGIEVMLRAMPAIVRAHPETLYIVLGATHPEVVKHEGHAYRYELQQIVRDLNLQKHVHFDDKFVSGPALQEFLIAADIYVTPYLAREQLTSGTLAFAVGAGKAVVSTPYWAAQELLAEGRGRLVPFGDSRQMANTIIELLGDASARRTMQTRAYEYGRARTWAKVGAAYWKLFLEMSGPNTAAAVFPQYPRSAALLPAGRIKSVELSA